MTPEERRHLYLLVQAARGALQRWLDAGPGLLPEEPLYQRLDELAVLAGVVVPHAGPLENALLAMAQRWRQFLALQQQTLDPMLEPDEDFWASWQALYQVVREQTLPRPKRIESIQELLKQEVPKHQICQIYGFVDEQGFPDYRKLDEEIAQPGTHTGAGWIAPVNRYIQAVREAAEREDADLRERLAARQVVPLAAEGIGQLVAAGVAAVQIARLKGMTVEEVYAWCEREGVPPPPPDYAQELQRPGAYDRPLSPERQRSLDALGPAPAETPEAAPAEEKPRKKR